MNNYGIFIHHRHNHRHLAGRVFDFLSQRGLKPFLDTYSLHSGDYHHIIEEELRNAPYFLCVLTRGALDNLKPDSLDDVYYQELELAFESQKEILAIASEDFVFPDTLPHKVSELRFRQTYKILNNMSNFFDVMERLSKDIDMGKLTDIVNWRELARLSGHTLILPRSELENSIATLENRFGNDFVQCVKENKPYKGEYRIRLIHSSCYAANILFSPRRDYVDDSAYDYGIMFNILRYLLQDPEFSFEIVLNAPDSYAAKDAYENNKLGNSGLEDIYCGVFYASFAGINGLIESDSIFQTAFAERRFRFMITDRVMPYAIFHIQYKDEWSEFNHIKVDLYSSDILSSMDRRSMLFFERDDKPNYDFFRNQYQAIRDYKKSQELISEHGEKWKQYWLSSGRQGNLIS